ncbi:hypothetical protein [Streptomyces sp. NPDC056682]|uniref:hypothetical protein n=1 Tax=Streptomyces sp. NPDC056682 TaxID=3345909 RepID=UPI0036C7A962
MPPSRSGLPRPGEALAPPRASRQTVRRWWLIGLGVVFLLAAALTLAVDRVQGGALLGALVTGAIGVADLVSGIRQLH